jgi:ribosomal protein S12 methylthiotransferase
MAAQHSIAAQVSQSFVGRAIRVLVEGNAKTREPEKADIRSWEHGLLREAGTQNSKLKASNYVVARSEADAPDIDGRVYVRGRLPIGEFARVRIVGHTGYDLIAEPTGE